MDFKVHKNTSKGKHKKKNITIKKIHHSVFSMMGEGAKKHDCQDAFAIKQYGYPEQENDKSFTNL